MLKQIRSWTLRSLMLGAVASASLVTPLPLVATAEAKNVFMWNHPDLDWYSIETEHFVVHYPVSRKKEGNDHYLTGEWTAKKTAKVAEEMWPRMCAEFNYYLKERIHIVILNQGDDLEGFTVPQWDWIEISANPGGDFYRQRGRMDWLPDVLVHEFAHVVSLKAQGTLSEGAMYAGIGSLYNDGVNNSAIGGEVYVIDSDPFFWTEGGAEYWSDTAGYNWWTPSRDQHIRTTVLEDRLLSFDEWLTRQQTFGWGDGERGYQQGYSFALYLRQRFGSETYAKFALEYAKKWRSDWTTVMEDVTGVPARQLYDDWVAYLTEKYNGQYAAIKAEGEVAGRELSPVAKDWEYTDPAGRDEWQDLRWKRKWGMTGEKIARRERERAKEATGTWQMVPRYSDDGEWVAINNRMMLQVIKTPEASWTAFGGQEASDEGYSIEGAYNFFRIPNGFMHAWDFVPGQDAVVVTGQEHSFPKMGEQLTGVRFEADGYDWKQLWYVPIPVEEATDKNLQYQGAKERKFLGRPLMHFPDAYPIPNTLRGTEPAVSPDGKKVAYLEYTDGTLNLVTINIDGSDKKHLTNFNDGTWMQRMEWSPDGKQIAVAIFRNFQQDIYIMDADGSNVRPIMFDRWEDQDPWWGTDGKIYFSSDRTGVFNIYAYDTASGSINQLTNVIGGAQAPSLTPDGNLMYMNYTAHGWKVYGVHKADFLNKEVTGDFRTTYNAEVVQEAWEFREDLSAYVPIKYDHDMMSPAGVPLIRMTNDSLDDFGLQAGAVVLASDFVEDHSLTLVGLMGSDMILQGFYEFNGWYPAISLFALHAEVKYNSGFILDEDDNGETLSDRFNYELRNQQYYNIAGAEIRYPWNDRFNTAISGQFLDFGVRTTSDSDYGPYSYNAEGALLLNFSNIGFFAFSPNPTGGRNIDASYAYGFTDIVYQPYGGRSVDDGELFDKYDYHKAQLRWTEQLPMPSWAWLPQFLRDAAARRHTIQIDLQGGFVNRNVDLNDEFRAGGQHPYNWGSDSLRPNTLFAGYPQYSLSGETMLIANLAYRFPIRRELNWRVGPLYTYDVTAQFMGTAGNLWSYRAPEDEAAFYRNEYGDRVAYDPSSIRREIPFVDIANKNGNYMLYDAGAEVRVSSTLFSNVGWNSFFRVAYGFQDIRGYGDVDGDDLSDTTESAIGDELSNEVEPAGFRFYVGLGTGW